MTFSEIWPELLEGHKIKLSTWKGYWIWENDTIMIYCKNGTILDIRDTENPEFTFGNIATDDWEVLPDDYEIPNI